MIGPFSRVEVSQYDALAEIVIVASVSSVVRIVCELVGIFFSLISLPREENEDRYIIWDEIRFSAGTIGKAAIEFIPIVGNAFAIYCNRSEMRKPLYPLEPS